MRVKLINPDNPDLERMVEYFLTDASIEARVESQGSTRALTDLISGKDDERIDVFVVELSRTFEHTRDIIRQIRALEPGPRQAYIFLNLTTEDKLEPEVDELVRIMVSQYQVDGFAIGTRQDTHELLVGNIYHAMKENLPIHLKKGAETNTIMSGSLRFSMISRQLFLRAENRGDEQRQEEDINRQFLIDNFVQALSTLNPNKADAPLRKIFQQHQDMQALAKGAVLLSDNECLLLQALKKHQGAYVSYTDLAEDMINDNELSNMRKVRDIAEEAYQGLIVKIGQIAEKLEPPYNDPYRYLFEAGEYGIMLNDSPDSYDPASELEQERQRLEEEEKEKIRLADIEQDALSFSEEELLRVDVRDLPEAERAIWESALEQKQGEREAAERWEKEKADMTTFDRMKRLRSDNGANDDEPGDPSP